MMNIYRVKIAEWLLRKCAWTPMHVDLMNFSGVVCYYVLQTPVSYGVGYYA